MSLVRMGDLAPMTDDEIAALPGNRSLSFDEITISGAKPPSFLASALPWLIGAAVVGTLSWLAYRSYRRRARRKGGRPFVG